MPNGSIGKILLITLSIWAFLMIAFWLYAMFCVVSSWRSFAVLLRQVREVSQETFDYLHKGNITSTFGVVPYVSINVSRLNAFVENEQLNEYPNIKLAKAEWQRINILMKRNLTIWLSMMGIGFVLMVIGGILIASGVLN